MSSAGYVIDCLRACGLLLQSFGLPKSVCETIASTAKVSDRFGDAVLNIAVWIQLMESLWI